MRAAAAAWLLLAVAGVAAVVSIDRGLPADFGGFLDGDPDNVLGDFLGWRGTAIAPPLALMIVIAVLARLAPRDRRALGALTVVGAGAVVGYLGEPATWELDAVNTPLVVAGVALSAAIVALGLRELRRPGLVAVAV